MKTSNQYVPGVAVRDDILFLLKQGVYPVDIARAADLHLSTIERIVADNKRKVTRQTVTKVNQVYMDFRAGKITFERRRLHSWRGHPATWTHCINGHPYTERNTYIDAKKVRRCRICLANRRASYRARVALREAS